jgi:hypothetical protein
VQNTKRNVYLLKGFHNTGLFIRPNWVSPNLHTWYFILRTEKPKSAKRRKLYRLIEKEKLSLSELGIDQELIKATCRYLSCYSQISGKRMVELMERPNKQMCFDFT